MAQKRGSTLSNYQYDGLGSTRALTDAAGTVTDEYFYDAFGVTLATTGSTINNYLFTGEQFDSGLNNYYLRARYYDQRVGRFTQQDTWMGNNSDPITLHKYLYANADPVTYTDPTGNFSIAGTMKAVSVATTLVSTAQAGYELWGDVQEGKEISPTQVGMVALASLGGFKLFKLVGKKFLKKYGCDGPKSDKGICKIFQSDGKRIAALRSTLGIGKNKNIAFADYITSDGVGTMVAASGRHTHPGTVGMPTTPKYFTFSIGHSRALDSEVKLYENLALKFNSGTKGLTRLVSELTICMSCAGVGVQFRSDFPGVFLMTRGGVSGRSKK